MASRLYIPGCTTTSIIFPILILFSILFRPILAQTTNLTKRGLLYINTNDPSDYNTFLSPSSPLTWYYTFSTYPALQSRTNFQFISMIHDLTNLDATLSIIKTLPSGSNILLFNEPDGSTASGGSDISPSDAAQAYISTISVLRSSPYNFRFSVPATTGSSMGMTWLQNFNESCYSISSRTGCIFDFVAAHWYGDFASMASWLGSLHSMYPGLPVWLTEFAIPQASDQVTLDMLNQSLSYLDQTEYVQRYAWFGAFRENNANGFTGSAVSFWDDNGGLTDVGALYLGGQARGFTVGEKGAAARLFGLGWWRVLIPPVLVVGWMFCGDLM